MTRSAVRQGLRTSGWMLLAVGIAFLVLFWPQSLGGRVAYVRVDGQSMYPTLHMGDLAVVRHQSSYRVGDPVAYRIPKGEFGAGALVIHRLVGGNGVTGYVTKGDNKNLADEWHPRTPDILGRVRYDLPGVGPKLATLTKPIYVGGLVAGLTVLVMLLPAAPRRPRRSRSLPLRPTAVRPTELVRRAQETDPVGPSRRGRRRRHNNEELRTRRSRSAARSAP